METEMLTPISEKALCDLIKETCLILRQDPSIAVRNEALKVYRELADAVIRFQALDFNAGIRDWNVGAAQEGGE